MRIVLVVIAVALPALGPALARADWREPVGGPSPINESATRNADELALTTVAGVPYVVWNEDTTVPGQGGSSQIRVARLAADGASWEKVADAGSHPISRLSTTSSHFPSIAALGTVPWVAWSENITQTDQEIRVAHLIAGVWQRVVDTAHPINHLRSDPGGTADYPTIADGGANRPFVSFFEADPGSGSLVFPGSNPAEIWVDRLSADGASWEEVGGGPVSDPSFDAAFPRLATVGGVPWVVYFQVAMVGGNPALTIAAAHLSADGQNWVHVGPLATGGFDQFDNPAIASVAGRPEVAFGDKGAGATHRIRALRLNDSGDGWDELGGGPASDVTADASGASIAEIGGAPWLAWHETGGGGGGRTVRVARLTDGGWERVGGQVDLGTGSGSDRGPVLASVGGFPWVAFGENDGSQPQANPQCCTQERVSRLEPTLDTPTAGAAATSATLLTRVADRYGLPFPVGFSFAPKGGAETLTPMSLATDDPDVVFSEITGLAPATLYFFHPVATAGTPLPLVEGPLGYFLTSSTTPVTTGGGGAPPTAQGGAGNPVARLAAAIVRVPRRVRSGHPLRVKTFVTIDCRVALLVRRGHRLVKRLTADVPAGTRTFTWTPPRRASGGRYLLVLWAETATGRHARDVAAVRVVH